VIEVSNGRVVNHRKDTFDYFVVVQYYDCHYYQHVLSSTVQFQLSSVLLSYHLYCPSELIHCFLRKPVICSLRFHPLFFLLHFLLFNSFQVEYYSTGTICNRAVLCESK
jgi:hypothetical protein